MGIESQICSTDLYYQRKHIFKVYEQESSLEQEPVIKGSALHGGLHPSKFLNQEKALSESFTKLQQQTHYNRKGRDKRPMTRLDFNIIALLHSKDAINEAVGLTVNEIIEIIPIVKAITIYKRLQDLVKTGYVLKGFKASRADTFYISDKGISLDEKYDIKDKGEIKENE